MSKIGVVVTTIGDGQFLAEYTRQIEEENRKEQVTIYVIPDLKSSKELWKASQAEHDKGFDVRCISIPEQDVFAENCDLRNLIPYNSDNRRNIGYLMALGDGCEAILSMDDDNYPRAGTGFYQDHALVGFEAKLRTRSVRTHWYNVLADLGLPHVYPRGFPYRHREETCFFQEVDETRKVMINVGLWLGDPDLDAVTWVHGGVKATLFRGKSFFLGPHTWSPISSQNTAVHRDVMVSYYFLPMNTTVRGLEMDRYGDMFSGYFAEACAKHMGDGIRVGTPVVDHRRNSHQHWDDVRKELVCIGMVEDLMDWLVQETLEGKTYGEAYLSLADKLEDAVERFHGSVWTVDARAYFHRAAYCMRRWTKVCTKVTENRKDEQYASVS